LQHISGVVLGTCWDLAAHRWRAACFPSRAVIAPSNFLSCTGRIVMLPSSMPWRDFSLSSLGSDMRKMKGIIAVSGILWRSDGWFRHNRREFRHHNVAYRKSGSLFLLVTAGMATISAPMTNPSTPPDPSERCLGFVCSSSITRIFSLFPDI